MSSTKFIPWIMALKAMTTNKITAKRITNWITTTLRMNHRICSVRILIKTKMILDA